MSDAALFAKLAQLPPAEAVAYLQARNLLQTTYNWQDMWQEEHARAFTVSRLANADLLQTLSDKITASVQGDLTRRDFMREAKSALAQAGWWGEHTVLDPLGQQPVTTTFDPSRLKLIYDTNVRTAHAAGRWQRFEASRATHPYIRYVTMHDERVRASHAAFDGVTLPIDDPFWDSHTPPLGYRCRCRLVAVNKKDYDGGKTPGGQPMKKTAPDLGSSEFVNTRTGEVTRVPNGITPGFGYNPGKVGMAKASTIQIAVNKLAGYDANLGAVVGESLAAGASASIQQQWGDWLARSTSGEDRNQLGWLGVITTEDLTALKTVQIEPVSAEVMVRPELVFGPKATRHNQAGDALTHMQWQTLPGLFATAPALLLDTVSGKLVYLLAGDGRSPQLAVEVDYVLKKPKTVVNAVVSAYTANDSDIRQRLVIGDLVLLRGSVGE